MPLQPTRGEYSKMFSSLYRSDILPRATLIDDVQVATNSVFSLETGYSLPVNLPDSSKLYKNEKSTNVDRIGIPRKIIVDGKEQTVYETFYFKPYDRTLKFYDKMISSALLGMHAVPHEPYGVSFNGRNGVATIDLTNLRDSETKEPVKVVRFDILLNSLGYPPDILTFMDLQTLFYDKRIPEIMDRRAFVQIALGNFFLSNAFGETDPNSRNLIMLESPNAEPMDPVFAKRIYGKGYKEGAKKIGFAVRIDADENTHDTSKNHERSGQRIIGRSMLFPNESVDTPMKLSRDDKEILMEYCANPAFVLEGSFIPPEGMTEHEYIMQIEQDDLRLKMAREIFKKQVIQENPELENQTFILDQAIEELMNKHNCYARKKSFTQLIEERNPNIDWGLFEELFMIADRSVNETTIRFPTDSMYYRQNSIMRNQSTTNRSYLSQRDYDDFALSIYDRAQTSLHMISKALAGFKNNSFPLKRLDNPSSKPLRFEPQPVNKKGVPVIEKPASAAEKTEE